MLFYQTEKISPEKAALYQFVLPVPFVNLGFAYSDNWEQEFKMGYFTTCMFSKGNDIDWGENTAGSPVNPDKDLGQDLKSVVMELLFKNV